MNRQTWFLLCALLLICVIIAQTDTDTDDHDHDHYDEDTDTDHDDHESHEEHDSHDDHDHGEESERNIAAAIGITVLAGCSAFIGSCSIFCIKPEQLYILTSALAFSAGVVIHLSFMSLIPECIHLLEGHAASEALARFFTLLCVIGGGLLSIGTEMLLKMLGVSPHAHNGDDPSYNSGTTSNEVDTAAAGAGTGGAVQLEAQSPSADPTNEVALDTSPRGRVASASVIQPAGTKPKDTLASKVSVSYSVALALILHHFPEGIATFISLYHDFNFGLLVAIALSLHDVPSGICISIPVYCATGSKLKPFILCGIAAAVYPLGAFIGWAIVVSASDVFIDTFIGICVGIISGVMLYIAFVELLPTAFISASRQGSVAKHEAGAHDAHNPLKWPLLLLFAGMLIMEFSSILLAATGGHSH